MSSLDSQVGGEHYKCYAIQPIEFIQKNNLSFIEGCIVKYICRYKHKGGKKDLEKIKHYIDLLIEMEYEDADQKKDLHKKIPQRHRRAEAYRAWWDPSFSGRACLNGYGTEEILEKRKI